MGKSLFKKLREKYGEHNLARLESTVDVIETIEDFTPTITVATEDKDVYELMEDLSGYGLHIRIAFEEEGPDGLSTYSKWREIMIRADEGEVAYWIRDVVQTKFEDGAREWKRGKWKRIRG